MSNTQLIQRRQNSAPLLPLVKYQTSERRISDNGLSRHERRKSYSVTHTEKHYKKEHSFGFSWFVPRSVREARDTVEHRKPSRPRSRSRNRSSVYARASSKRRDDDRSKSTCSSGSSWGKQTGAKEDKGRMKHNDCPKRYSEEMPSHIELLIKQPDMILDEMVKVVKRHLEKSSQTHKAFLCDGRVYQVLKHPKEGYFCGYRNIQMMAAHVKLSRLPGFQSEFLGSLEVPSIFKIMKAIETAWERDINKRGYDEIGKILGTRKYIGTSEAEAFFKLIGTPCRTAGFSHAKKGMAADGLLKWVENYFRASPLVRKQRNFSVVDTGMAPIYLQNPRHSTTIVGIEKNKDGDLQLLVFDPKYSLSRGPKADASPDKGDPERFLRYYRRGMKYLSQFDRFEVLYFTVGQIETSYHERAGYTFD